MKALLRRTQSNFGEGIATIYRYDPIEMNIETHKVTVNGKNVELTFKEFELLKFLLQNKGTVVTRSRLMDTVWGFAFAVNVPLLHPKSHEATARLKVIGSPAYGVSVNVFPLTLACLMVVSRFASVIVTLEAPYLSVRDSVIMSPDTLIPVFMRTL